MPKPRGLFRRNVIIQLRLFTIAKPRSSPSSTTIVSSVVVGPSPREGVANWSFDQALPKYDMTKSSIGVRLREQPGTSKCPGVHRSTRVTMIKDCRPKTASHEWRDHPPQVVGLDVSSVGLQEPPTEGSAGYVRQRLVVRAERSLCCYGRTRMIVFPGRRSLELKTATASSSVATVPIFVRNLPSRTRWTISPN